MVRYFSKYLLTKAAARCIVGAQTVRRLSNCLSEKELFCLGDAFKALADPTRRRILELLAQGDLTAGEIAAHFDMTKPSVSHHLNILRSAALITDERRGQNIVYSVNLTVFQELMKWFYDCGLVKGDDSNEKE